MGCIGSQSENTQPELVLNIFKEKDASVLIDDKITSYFKLNFIINLHTELTENIFKLIKEMLSNLHFSLSTSKETLNYYLFINFCQNSLESEVSYKIFREVIFFLHFTASKYNRRLTCDFEYSNIKVSYKNINFDSTEVKWSLFLLKDYKLNIIKEFSLKFHFENFLLFKDDELSINSVMKVLCETIEDKFKGIILPPIILNELELHSLLQKLSRLKLQYIEVCLKIDINNFHKLKSLISTLSLFFNYYDNIAISFIFYNIKLENINKVSELIIQMLPLESYFIIDEMKVFYLKLFFVIYENNSVDYKYYIFKGMAQMTKKSRFKNTEALKIKTEERKTYFLFNKISGELKDKIKIIRLINCFLFSSSLSSYNSLYKNEYNSKSDLSINQFIRVSSENLKSLRQATIDQNFGSTFSQKTKQNNSFSNTSNFPRVEPVSISSIDKKNLSQVNGKNTIENKDDNIGPYHTLSQSRFDNFNSNSSRCSNKFTDENKNYYQSDYQSRKFFIDDHIDLKNFNPNYNDKYIEFYKNPYQ